MALLTSLVKQSPTIPDGIYLTNVIRVFEGMRLIKTQIPAYQMPIFGFTFSTIHGSITCKFDLLGTNTVDGQLIEDDVKTAALWTKLGKFGYCCGYNIGDMFNPSQLLNKQCRIIVKNNKIIKITPP